MSLVVLRNVPDDLLRGLSNEDVAAIRAAVGKPVYVVEGADAVNPCLRGTVEVEFRAADDSIHTIWVNPDHLEYLK
jgi:hypothetical protein